MRRINHIEIEIIRILKNKIVGMNTGKTTAATNCALVAWAFACMNDRP